jgi:NTP pyrophosphatase (non-canonical NTP hydrolase)
MISTEIEHLLICLIEECSEVQKACTKALRFGLNDTWHPSLNLPEWKLTPAEEIEHELNDVAGVVSLLNAHGVVLQGDKAMVDAKKAKVLKMLEYSRDKGTLI